MACHEGGSTLQLHENGHCGKKPGMTATNKQLELTTGKTKESSKHTKKDLSKKETSCSKSYDKHSSATLDKSVTDSSKKFPPFRAGKYVPRESVYSPLSKTERLSSSKGKSSNEKLNLSPSSSPPTLRANKASHRVSSVYANAGERFDSSCVKVKQGAGRGSNSHSELTSSKSHVTTTNSPRSASPKGRVILHENRRACSLEGISKPTQGNTLKTSSQISHSADSVDGRKPSPKTRPKSYSVENTERRRLRTEKESSSRPMSAVMESPKQRLTKSAKGALNPLYKIIQDNSINHQGVENRDKLTPLSPKSPRGNLDPKSKSRPKSITVLETRVNRDNQGSRRFLRKGSDSRDTRPPRPKSAVILSSSESERTYRQIRTRKARRLPQRNIYVKRRRKPNTSISTPQRTPLVNKTTKYNERKQAKTTSKDQVDSITLPAKKKKIFSAFGDKFCVRTKIIDKEIFIPKLKRCRVMVWKIRRISYDLYEKVTFLNPMVTRKPKLQRQKKLFNIHKGKNFLRAGQMNTNVATWARLLKRAAPTNCTTNNSALSPNTQQPLPDPSSRTHATVATPPRPQPYIPDHSKGPSKVTSPNTYQVPHPAQTTPKRPAEREVQDALSAFGFLDSPQSPQAHPVKTKPPPPIPVRPRY